MADVVRGYSFDLDFKDNKAADKFKELMEDPSQVRKINLDFSYFPKESGGGKFKGLEQALSSGHAALEKCYQSYEDLCVFGNEARDLLYMPRKSPSPSFSKAFANYLMTVWPIKDSLDHIAEILLTSVLPHEAKKERNEAADRFSDSLYWDLTFAEIKTSAFNLFKDHLQRLINLNVVTDLSEYIPWVGSNEPPIILHVPLWRMNEIQFVPQIVAGLNMLGLYFKDEFRHEQYAATRNSVLNEIHDQKKLSLASDERDKGEIKDSLEENASEFEDEESSDESVPLQVDPPFKPGDIKIEQPPMNMGDLIDRLQYGWITLETPYQRSPELWNAKQQSRLIESAILGLRLPAFFFEEIDRNNWQVIDGLQRCCAVRNFCGKKQMELKDLELMPQLNGMTYDKLSFELVRDLRMLPITVNVLDKSTPSDVKFILFERLNTGGIKLTDQEIRTAVYRGKAIDTITEMSESAEFKEVTGHVSTKRQQDKNLVSRFATFYLLGESTYKPPLRSYINEAMKSLNKADTTTLDKMKKDFREALVTAGEVFGKQAFRRSKQDGSKAVLNVSYFEVITVVLARAGDDVRERLLQNKELFRDNAERKMSGDEQFSAAFTRAVDHTSAVHLRYRGFEEVVKKTLAGEKL